MVISGLGLCQVLSLNLLKRKNSINDKEIILVYQGRVFSIENLRSHINLPLDVGQMTDKDTFLCLYHNSEFLYVRFQRIGR